MPRDATKRLHQAFPAAQDAAQREAAALALLRRSLNMGYRRFSL